MSVACCGHGNTEQNAAADVTAAMTLVRGVRAREKRVKSLRGYLTCEVWRSDRAARMLADYAKETQAPYSVSPTERYGHYIVRFLVAEDRWHYRMATAVGLFMPPIWEGEANLGGRFAVPHAVDTPTRQEGEYLQIVEIGDGKRRLVYNNATAMLIASAQKLHAMPADQRWLGKCLFLSNSHGGLGEQMLRRLRLLEEGRIDAEVATGPAQVLAPPASQSLTFRHYARARTYVCDLTLRPDLGYAPVEVRQTARPRDKSRTGAEAYGDAEIWRGEKFADLTKGLWLPKEVTIQTFGYGPDIADPWRETCRLTFHELVVNGPWEESEFRFDPPIGTRIHGPPGLFPGIGGSWLPASPRQVKPKPPPPIIDERFNEP